MRQDSHGDNGRDNKGVAFPGRRVPGLHSGAQSVGHPCEVALCQWYSLDQKAECPSIWTGIKSACRTCGGQQYFGYEGEYKRCWALHLDKWYSAGS